MIRLKEHIDLTVSSPYELFKALGNPDGEAQLLSGIHLTLEAIKGYLKKRYPAEEFFVLLDAPHGTEGAFRVRVWRKTPMEGITVNSGKVGDLRRYLEKFPDDANIVIQGKDAKGYYKKPLAIGCNFAHQEKHGEVLVFMDSCAPKKYD